MQVVIVLNPSRTAFARRSTQNTTMTCSTYLGIHRATIILVCAIVYYQLSTGPSMLIAEL